MRRPSFRLDGRVGALRGTDAGGRPVQRTGRLCVLLDGYLQGVLAGTLHPTAEMRLTGGRPWHPLECTVEEAREMLLARRLGGAATVRRCEAIRESRARRGLPLTPPLTPG